MAAVPHGKAAELQAGAVKGTVEGTAADRPAIEEQPAADDQSAPLDPPWANIFQQDGRNHLGLW